MEDTGFLLLGMLVAIILLIIPVGLMIYVCVGPVTRKKG